MDDDKLSKPKISISKKKEGHQSTFPDISKDKKNIKKDRTIQVKHDDDDSLFMSEDHAEEDSNISRSEKKTKKAPYIK
jgi:hypothetical protein